MEFGRMQRIAIDQRLLVQQLLLLNFSIQFSHLTYISIPGRLIVVFPCQAVQPFHSLLHFDDGTIYIRLIWSNPFLLFRSVEVLGNDILDGAMEEVGELLSLLIITNGRFELR